MNLDVLDAMLDAEVLKPKTYADYIKQIESYEEWCNERRRTSWTAESAERWILQNAETLKVATLLHKLSALKCYVYCAMQMGVILPREAYFIERLAVSDLTNRTPSDDSEITSPLTDKQVEQLLKQPDTSRIGGIRDFALLSVGVYCGLTRSEFTLMQVPDVRRETLTVHGGNARKIKPPIPAIEALEPWIELVKKGPVWRSINKANHISSKQSTWLANRLHVVYGISFRQMRMTCVRKMHDQGYDSAAICQYLGVLGEVRRNTSLSVILAARQ